MADLIHIERRKKPEPVELVHAPVSLRRRIESICIGIILTLLLHVGTYEAMPANFGFGGKAEDTPKPHDIQVHLMPRQEEEPLAQQKKPEELPPLVVPSNPDVPANKPDKARAEADRDQQAANPDVPKKLDPENNPALKGEDKDSIDIVSDNAMKAAPHFAEPVPPPPEQQQQPQQQVQLGSKNGKGQDDRDLTPPTLPNREKVAEADGKGIASPWDKGESPDIPKTDTKQVKVLPGVVTPDIDKAQVARQQIGSASETQQKPLPRPRLIVRETGVTPHVLRNSDTGVNNTGAVAYNANFSEYGDYIARMMEVVETKWHDLNSYGRADVTDTRSHVTIRFYIDKKGEIEDLQILDTNATQLAQLRCVDAIKANAPYFPWTADMVRVLGDRQPVSIQFLYW